MTIVQKTLRSLGITRNYKGYQRIICAVHLALEDESRLSEITHKIYKKTAAQYGCEWTAVERSIRTAVLRAWAKNRPQLIAMAGYPLDAPPTVSEFIEIIVTYVQHYSDTSKAV